MVHNIQGKFNEMVVIKVDQHIFIAWQVHYYSIIWIIENLKHSIIWLTQTFGWTAGLGLGLALPLALALS